MIQPYSRDPSHRRIDHHQQHQQHRGAEEEEDGPTASSSPSSPSSLSRPPRHRHRLRPPLCARVTLTICVIFSRGSLSLSLYRPAVKGRT